MINSDRMRNGLAHAKNRRDIPDSHGYVDCAQAALTAAAEYLLAKNTED